jgi:hypothetical protein
MSEVSTFTFLVHTGEVAFLLWLLIMGAKEQIVSSPPYACPTLRYCQSISASMGLIFV